MTDSTPGNFEREVGKFLTNESVRRIQNADFYDIESNILCWHKCMQGATGHIQFQEKSNH